MGFRLRHEAGFRTHGVGRPRLSVTSDTPDTLRLHGIPADIREIASKAQDERSEDETKKLREYFLAHHNPDEALQKRVAEIEKQKAASFPATMIMQDLPQPRPTFILNRGQYNEPTDEVGCPDPLGACCLLSGFCEIRDYQVEPDHGAVRNGTKAVTERHRCG